MKWFALFHAFGYSKVDFSIKKQEEWMNNFLMYPVSKRETTSIRETRLMLRVCPHCPHKASTAQLLLKHTLINPGSDWSIFTFLIYENRDQQGLWSIWFTHVSPGLYNPWLGKAACCSQGRGWGKIPPSSSSLRGMGTFRGAHQPGLGMAFTSWTHHCLLWVLCLACSVNNTAFELHFGGLHCATHSAWHQQFLKHITDGHTCRQFSSSCAHTKSESQFILGLLWSFCVQA